MNEKLTVQQLNRMKVKDLQGLAEKFHLFNCYNGAYKKDHKRKDEIIDLIGRSLDKINYVLDGSCERLNTKIQNCIFENKMPKFNHIVFKIKNDYFSYKVLKKYSLGAVEGMRVSLWPDTEFRFHIDFGGGNKNRNYICFQFNNLDFKLYEDINILYLYGDILRDGSEYCGDSNYPTIYKTTKSLEDFLINKNKMKPEDFKRLIKF